VTLTTLGAGPCGRGGRRFSWWPPRAGPVGVLAEEEERSVDRGVAYDFLWREAPHPEQVFIYRDSGSIEVGFCCKTMLDTWYPIATSMSSAMLLLVLWIGIPRELIKYLRNNELPIPSH